ncbi:uncharacterized protein [Lepeophtheirus salmonis]|uniref:uncharacterized protein isoform X2 n=1 Tax=Lepeophtheirus salmonis TaxID=72036 RepID=UPI001AE6F9BC|nr:uncharacterized protein LOC121120658 isoform X2 [Lepeophtheirus salmonis]
MNSVSTPSIPSSFKDINSEWIISMCKETLYPPQKQEGFLSPSPKIEVDIKPWADGSQGALSDILLVFVHASIPIGRSQSRAHHLFVKVIPQSMRKLILKHRLFERELIMYRDVFPLLIKKVIDDRVPGFQFKHFLLPKYVFGAVKDGKGVLVLEDLSRSGYTINDSSFKLFDVDKLDLACGALAEFHALSMAFNEISDTKLEEIFPILDPKGLIWFQDDMLPFINAMNVISKAFLKSLPNEQETLRRFEKVAMDPMDIFNDEISRKGYFDCLQHGDSWHNNFLFEKKSHKSAIIDWQLSYYGNGLSDLSYLIYSSTSKFTRLEQPNFLVHSYLNVLTSTLTKLELSNICINLSVDNFLNEFKKHLFPESTTNPSSLWKYRGSNIKRIWRQRQKRFNIEKKDFHCIKYGNDLSSSTRTNSHDKNGSEKGKINTTKTLS